MADNSYYQPHSLSLAEVMLLVYLSHFRQLMHYYYTPSDNNEMFNLFGNLAAMNPGKTRKNCQYGWKLSATLVRLQIWGEVGSCGNRFIFLIPAREALINAFFKTNIHKIAIQQVYNSAYFLRLFSDSLSVQVFCHGCTMFATTINYLEGNYSDHTAYYCTNGGINSI